MCPTKQTFEDMKASMTSSDLEHTVYETSEDTERDFPMFSIKEDMSAVYEHNAGTLHPDTATKAFQVFIIP